MFAHKISEKVSYRTYADWLLLAFLAGNINTGGFLSCQRFVSHVTGFATLAGVSLAQDGWLHVLGTLTIPVYFLLGVMISAYLTEKKFAYKHHGQRFAPVMALVGLLLTLAFIGGQLSLFGTFGDVAKIEHDYVLLALLCTACGLQNASITSASGSTIRTTHLTGLTTDLGISLVRMKLHNLTDEERFVERRTTLLRMAIIATFILGSFIGALFYLKWHYTGFLVPAAIAFYTAFEAKRDLKIKN